MNRNDNLTERVYEIVQAVRSGNIDPLELRLTDSYKELQELIAELDNRIDIDEMLNEVLGVKVSRVQELARVLASPEIYVARLKGKSTRDLAKLLSVRQPVIFNHLEHDSLNGSLERIVQLIDAMSREPPEEIVPDTSGLPNGFALETEDAVFMEDIEKFLESIPFKGKVIFDDIVENKEFDVFLKNFLYIIILVSRGQLHFNPVTRQLWKPIAPEAT
ncbi:hypothetical protein EU527_10170 [Candidatus Thorarchaeota archaeon]|nr:MAG: hypothetical protein EU527_10170 [Candidatus Thorarchaeota archaeon]